MADIAELGFAVDSAPLAAANAELQKMPANAANTAAGVEKVNNSLKNSSGGITKFMSGIVGIKNELIGGLKQALAQAALGIGLTFGGLALFNKLTQTVDQLDAVSKAARSVGSSVQSMQALASAAQLAGIGVDALEAATRRQNRAIGAAIESGKGNAGVFKELGITAQALAAMPIDVRFATIADRMKALGFDTAQTTAALALLGDRGGSLVALMGEGGDKIREATAALSKFNMGLTDVQGKQIEALHDSFVQLGYSVQGAFNQFIATIAPALSAIIDGIATGIALIVTNFHLLEPVLQIVAPALVLMFGPTVIAAVWAFAGAVLTGAVDAMIALTAAIAANPLGALAIAIVTIISAIWTFRDAIKNAFGIDVVSIVKSVANSLIQSFVAAFEKVKSLWSNFPSILGGFIIDAANAMITGLNFMIASAVGGMNSLINDINGISSKVGIAAIPTLGSTSVPTINNPFSADNAKTAAALQATLANIYKTDYIGLIADQFKTLTKSTDTSTISTKAATGALAAVGATASDVTAQIAEMNKPIVDAAKQLADLRQTLMDTVGQAFKDFFSDIMQGKSAVVSLTDALGNLANKLIDMVENNALTGLISALTNPGGAGSTALPGFYGIVPPSANGNVFSNAGLPMNSIVSTPTLFPFAHGIGLAGEAGPEAIMPLTRINGKLGVAAANYNGGGNGPVLLQPIIYNNASNDVQVSTSQNQNGDLVVQIDKIISDQVTNSGSKTHKAMKSTFGLSRATIKR